METLRRAGGAARTRRLRSVPRRTLERAVAAGLVERPEAGLYHLPNCDPAALAAAAVDGVLSCASAAVDRGLPVLGVARPVHVTASRGTTRTWPRTVVHRREVSHDGRRTDLLQTLLDCLRCCEAHEGVAIADHALHHDLVSQTELAAARRSLHPSDPVRALLDLVDGRSMSPPESWARVFLVLAGFAVDTQVFIDEVGWIDILVDGWLVVEIDGSEYHRESKAFANDRRRDRAAYPQGYVVIRFPAVEVLRRETFLQEVRRVHAAGPPRR